MRASVTLVVMALVALCALSLAEENFWGPKAPLTEDEYMRTCMQKGGDVVRRFSCNVRSTIRARIMKSQRLAPKQFISCCKDLDASTAEKVRVYMNACHTGAVTGRIRYNKCRKGEESVGMIRQGFRLRPNVGVDEMWCCQTPEDIQNDYARARAEFAEAKTELGQAVRGN